MKSADILADVKKLLQEQMQAVTYKWLARQYGLPANTAKQLLFVFFEQNRKLTKATFLLAGWTKQEPRTHIVRLVDASKVLAVKETLQPLTSYHAYSVQPSKPQDSAALANTDYVQLERLFQQLLKAKDAEAVTDNCLANNSCSGVSCSAAVWDVGLTKRPSDPAIVAAAAAERMAADAKRGDKPKATSVPDKPSQQTGGLPAGKAGKVTSSVQRTASSKAASAASHLSGLWTKAPPKKPPTADPKPEKAVAGGKKGRAVKTSGPAPAADAEAALRAAQKEDDSSDDDGDDLQPKQRDGAGGRSSARNNGAMLVDNDDDALEQDESPAKPAARPSGNRGRRALVEDSSDDEMADAQPLPAATTAAGEGDEIDVDLDMDPANAEQNAPAEAKRKAKALPKRGRKKKSDDVADAEEGARPVSGTGGRVKLNSNAAAGSKRRKVTKTSYNDQGEEITEVVWEDEAVVEPAAAAGAKHIESQPSAAEDASGSTALRERQANGNAGGEAAGSQPTKKPSSPKKSGKAAGKPSGKAAGKTSGKGKADPNQRGIMAFFNSK